MKYINTLVIIIITHCTIIGQDLNLQKFETNEYTVYFDKDWELVKGNNIVQWQIHNQFGGTQYNLVIEELNEKIGKNITFYAIASISQLNKVISNFELLSFWEGSIDNSVIISYTGVIGNKKSTFLQYELLKNNKAYVLTSRFDGGIEMNKLDKLAKLMTFVFHLK